MQALESLHKRNAAFFVEPAADVIQHFAVKMLDKPVKAVLHFQIDDDVRVLLEIHRLHFQHLGFQSLDPGK